ncbi:hypothetical protein DCC26_06845, partial [Auritidibacter sp. NML120779]
TEITGPTGLITAIDAHRELISQETLTTQLELVADENRDDPRGSMADDASKLVSVSVEVVSSASTDSLASIQKA